MTERSTGRLAAAFATLALTGCADIPASLVPAFDLPKVTLPEALRTVDTVDRPTTLIGRALSQCAKRNPSGETACVKAAVNDAKLGIPALIALLPGCRSGIVCHVDYATDDRIGLVPAMATHYVVHWEARFDLTHRPATVDAVPISVVVT